MQDFLLFVVVGFVSQLVDGAIGMALGLTSMSVLLGLGVAPATASVIVLLSCRQIVTTASAS